MKGIVDRIEGELLIVELENGDMVDIPVEKVLTAKEGDVLLMDGDHIVIDHENTIKRSESIKSLFDELLE